MRHRWAGLAVVLLAACGNGGEEAVAPLPPRDEAPAPRGFEQIAQFSGDSDFSSEPLPVGDDQAAVGWTVTGAVQEFTACADSCVSPSADALARGSGLFFFRPNGYRRIDVRFLGAGTWQVTVYRKGPPPTTTTTEPPEPTVRMPTGSGSQVGLSESEAQTIREQRQACARQAGKVWLPDEGSPYGTCLDPEELGSAERGRAERP